MDFDLTNKTDEELEVIIRRAENTHVSGSLFQRAKLELELRDRRRQPATRSHIGGVFFEVAGDMRNDGVIQTGENAVVGIKVKGDYTSNKGKIIQNNSAALNKSWWKRPEILIALITLGVAIISIQWWPSWYTYFTHAASVDSYAPPAFQVTYQKTESQDSNTKLWGTTFEVSVLRPSGNFEPDRVPVSTFEAECSKAEWKGTNAGTTNGRQIFEKITYEIKCRSYVPIVDNKNLFKLEE